ENDEVDPEGPEDLDLLAPGQYHPRRALGREYTQRMRVEGHHGRRKPAPPRLLAHFAYETLVPEVQAVEVPDRRHDRTLRSRKGPVSGDDLHQAAPPRTVRVQAAFLGRVISS